MINFFKPKYKVGDTIYYSGILPDENGAYLPERTYKGVVEYIGGSWLSGYWYAVNKPQGVLYKPAVGESQILKMQYSTHNVGN